MWASRPTTALWTARVAVIAGLTRNLPYKCNASRMVGKEEKALKKIVINDEIAVLFFT